MRSVTGAARRIRGLALAAALVACGGETIDPPAPPAPREASVPVPSPPAAALRTAPAGGGIQESFEAPSTPFDDFPEEVVACTGPQRPVRIYSPLPVFPPQREGLTFPAKVVLESIIDKQGAIARVRVRTSFHPAFDQAAVDALKSWRFRPAVLGGRPLNVYYTLTVNYVLAPRRPV